MATDEIQSPSSPTREEPPTSVGKLVLVWVGALFFTLWAARADAVVLAMLAILVAGQAPQGAVGILGTSFLMGSILSAASAPFWYFIMRRGVGTGVKLAWVLISLFFVLNTVGTWAELASALPPAPQPPPSRTPGTAPTPTPVPDLWPPVPQYNDCMDKDTRYSSGRRASVDTGSGIGVRIRVFPYEDSIYKGAWPEGHQLVIECGRLMPDDTWYKVRATGDQEGWVRLRYLRF